MTYHQNYPIALCCAALAGLLVGCGTTSYENLKNTEASGDVFSKTLAEEYEAFAKSEIDQYDWPDQQLIADKGIKAAKGERPLPEDTKGWRLKDDDEAVLKAHRNDLIHWLNTDARFKAPVRSAKAQAQFDCWVEQQEENWQTEHIKACRDGLLSNLPVMSEIQFAFDSSSLSIKALENIRKVALDWRNDPSEGLLLQGHADKSGRISYNYRLSRKRAFAVKESLIAFGVPSDRIQLEIWGKSRPRQERASLPTGPTNRRVEILKF